MRLARIGIGFLLLPVLALSQHLSSARGIGMGAYTASVNDLSSLDWNPAGLIYMKDWEVSFSNYLSLRKEPGSNGFIFNHAGMGRQFLPAHAAGLRYTPGAVSEFTIPNLFTVIDSASNIQAKVDKKLTYAERYSLGYAYRFNEKVAFGVAARYRQEEVADTRFFTVRDSLTYISSRTITSTANSWNLDMGLTWEANQSWRFGLATKNLFKVLENEFPEDLKRYTLEARKALRVGFSHPVDRNLLVAGDISTTGDGAIGYEWKIWKDLSVRQGVLVGKTLSPFFNALTFGVGWDSKAILADVAYLRFSNRSTHAGKVSLNEFLAHTLHDVEFHPFTSDQVRFSLKVNLGRTREPLARIDYVEITSDIYPSSYEIFAYRPLGKVKVRNVSDRSIEAKAGFYLKPFMDGPTETRKYLIEPGGVVEIPFMAVFNEIIKNVTQPQLRDGEVYVVASPAEGYDDKSRASVRIYGRNNWNGEAIALRYFVTPTDPDVLQFSRSILRTYKEQLSGKETRLQAFEQAKILFDEFARRLSYVNDPRVSKDWVQYPGETLRLRGGDCDDMSVCFASILASVGISSAFIDVVPLQNPGEAHIYMMFDTGLEASKGNLISSNRKRYVIRKNQSGVETVWIPIETTHITKGFEEAWAIGAKEYLEDVELGLGLAKGWVKIVDVQ